MNSESRITNIGLKTRKILYSKFHILNSSRGFTLTELMVTLAIIAILAGIGVNFFGGAQRNARDQLRLRDLNSVRQGLELYKHDVQYYATSGALVFRCPSSTSTGLSSESKVYLDKFPADPACTATQNYQYQPLPIGCTGPDCVRYVLCAKSEGNQTYDIPPECTTSGLNCGGAMNDCNMGLASP